MDRRKAFARRPRPTGPNALQHSRAYSRVRVGKSDDVYLDPAKLRLVYEGIYNKSPGFWTLLAIVFSVGGVLGDLINRANEVEAVGGGSQQLKLELNRRREDWEGILQLLRADVFGDSEDSDADFAKAYKLLFVSFPQDEGEFEYENGSQLPPRYGLIWEIGSLSNQVWAMWHPLSWVHDDPDEPWYSWIPVAIAAGWVEAFNDVQGLVGQAPEQGPGWGAGIAQAAEQTEQAVIDIGNKGASLLKKAVGMAAGGALLGLLIGGALLGSRR